MGGRVADELHIPLAELGVQPTGLLSVALRSAPGELPGQQLRHLARELPHLMTNPTVHEVLNRKPDDLGQGDVRRLFEAFESVIEVRHEHGGRHTALSGCTYILRHFQQPLGDGSLAGQSGFRTKFEANPQHKMPTDIDAATEEEVAAVTFENLDERKSKAHAIFQKRKAAILQQCTAAFDEYDRICEELNRIEGAGLEGLPTRWAKKLEAGAAVSRYVLRNMPDVQRLQIAVHLANKRQAHLVLPKAAASGIIVSGIPLLQPLTTGTGQLAFVEALLARHYLPKSVVYACLSVLVLETALNRDTLATLKYSNVSRQGKGFLLHGVKPKTDELHTRKLFSSTDTGNREDDEPFEVVSDVAIKALSLLMANCKRYVEFARDLDPPLFGVVNLTDGSFPAPRPVSEKQFHEVRRLRPEWRFHVVQLRNLAAQVHYTSPDGDIFTTQALLQHATPHVTAAYLDDIVIKWLHQANINRYMKMLAATILWVVDRDDLIEQHQLRLFIHRPLLFPLMPGKTSGTTTAVDAWIASAGKSRFTIGPDEIHHLAHQHRYYRTHIKSLAERNPVAFLRYDLPRIVICLALRQVVNSSRHAALLSAFEERL